MNSSDLAMSLATINVFSIMFIFCVLFFTDHELDEEESSDGITAYGIGLQLKSSLRESDSCAIRIERKL
jgi:hypothetical protein